MTTFLHLVAEHILERHGSSMEKVAIVVPTRRAAFYVKQELANTTKTPLISPMVEAIDDFVEGICTLEVADSVSLLFELYETFKEIDPQVQFDRFMGWASVLISDLDKIDQYLVDTDYLFDYMSEAKAVERWQKDLPDGRSLQNTGGTKQYFSLFENIKKVYAAFRARLFEKGQAYRGMAYRQLAEHVDELLLTRTDYEKIYFAGFNAFTESEKKIIQKLVKASRAEVLWDTDQYYMTENTGVEAGTSLREYRDSATFGGWKWTGDGLAKSAKTITTYAVPNATLQTKVAGQLYADMKVGDELEAPVPTAIVLADENLLLPMLYSLDEGITDLNVTMGLSLRNSMLYTLIDCIFELQQNVAEFKAKDGRTLRIPKFNHKSITKVLNHPFVRHYEQIAMGPGADGLTAIQRTLREITDNNRVFLSGDDLHTIAEGHDLFKVLFTSWAKDNPKQVLQTFYDLIDLLREVYRDYKNALETEYLYLFFTLLKQFEQTLERRSEPLTLRTLRSFLYELIRQTRIPFSGEPISPLQILGMLETRALDFERIIILSLNEGVLPQAKKQNSLIPFDIAQEVGLPTHQHQEAVMSYHFYRLLQRAKDVHMLYVSTNDSPGGGEKSRFVQQVEFELTQYNKAIQVVNKVVEFEERQVEKLSEEVVKDEPMLASIRTHLGTKGLYPTHLNQLVRCSMQFYLKHIVGVEDKEEIEEDLGMDKIGTWLHASLERLDQEYFLLGTDPTEEQIRAVLRSEFEQLFRGYVTEEGLNRIYYQIGEQQILTFLNHQMAVQPRRKVIAAEQPLRAEVQLEIGGTPVTIQVGGKIDRVELSHDGTLYVMDYKTGSVQLSGSRNLSDPVKKEQILLTDTDIKAGYERQLWLYKYLMYKKMVDGSGLVINDVTYPSESYRIQSGFYSFREPTSLKASQLDLVEDGGAEPFIAESERLLKVLVSGLLNPEEPFRQTQDLNVCVYCDYRGICGR
ncbi:PD-(D/E)XK nuclease family protein [Telluribacter humicola]|uniref:PD-(D/E)XK nuclease family protein n=1 Tax=Telluribacter humicola TaxID=1720261 RepID=UPI001A97C507|nr:PD-(D/E)XK nuclease family protein [Telluribacter humicola]